MVNSILSIMGNTMTICAGGSCNSIYLSTVSAFFSAFGIPIVEYIHYLNFIAFFFIAISLISLYSVKNTWKYPPFIISTIGSIMICSDMIFDIHDYLTYIGNVLIIAGAIWNSRLNKFSFANRKKKKTPNGASTSAWEMHLTNRYIIIISSLKIILARHSINLSIYLIINNS